MRAMTAAGNSDPIDVVRNGKPARDHTIQVFTTGSPTVVAISLWGSTKRLSENPVYPTDYANLSGALDGAANPMTHITFKPVSTVICRLDTLTGGTNPTVTFGYNGGE